MRFKFKAITLAAASLIATSSFAGPFILAGTDADDHGSANTTTNFDGWLFMQKALENLASSSDLTTTNRVVVALGSDLGSNAGNAAASAFGFSSLAGAGGWTFQVVSDLTAPGAFATALGSAGIIMLDSGNSNVGGGLTGAEEAVLTANAAAIDSFVGGGGGLFSQAGDYGWLSTLVPGLSVTHSQFDGLALTAAGSTAFPALTNADLSAGPYHANFTNVGAIPVLAMGTGNQSGLNVIIGAAGGSITVPTNPVPEPSTYALMALGLAGIGVMVRRRKSKSA